MQAKNILMIAVAAALAGSASSVFAAPSDAQAREVWKQAIAASPAPAEGCFHANYPSTAWVKDECIELPNRFLAPPRRDQNGKWQTVGNGNDDVLEVTGHQITKIVGSFPSVTGVTSEKGVGVAAFGGGGILGANEYTLQINSGFDFETAACKSHSGCSVWQQAVYSPDYNTKGKAAVFIEYWLLGYGSTCPSGWESDGSGDCVKNSAATSAPDEVITQLKNQTLTMSVAAGGNDVTTFTDNGTAWTLTAKDSVLDLATGWDQAEFNVVGNAGGSKAQFNTGSSVTAKIAATDGSTATATCLKNGGTTGETNNLTLKSCTASGPSITIVESN